MFRLSTYITRIPNPFNREKTFDTKCIDVHIEIKPDLDLEKLFDEIFKIVSYEEKLGAKK